MKEGERVCSFVENFRVVGGESLKQRDGVGRREKILEDWGFRAEESDMVLQKLKMNKLRFF